MKRLFAFAFCGAVGLMAALPTAYAQQKTVKGCQEEWRANKAANQANKVTEKAYVSKCRAESGTPAAAPTPTAASSAEQKTVKACQEEWRANKAANQANKVTEKAYVSKCRAESGTPAAAPTPTAASSAEQKTVKACQEEWRANKAANQASKITEKAYVSKCRTGSGTPAAAPAPTVAPAQPAQAPAAATPKLEPAKPATGAVGANQFTTDTQAKLRCPLDTVVWVNLRSKIYHFAGHKDYGNTKKGAYMCEKDTAGAGARAAKDEKHP